MFANEFRRCVFFTLLLRERGRLITTLGSISMRCGRHDEQKTDTGGREGTGESGGDDSHCPNISPRSDRLSGLAEVASVADRVFPKCSRSVASSVTLRRFLALYLWAGLDSNQRVADYESAALTN